MSRKYFNKMVLDAASKARLDALVPGAGRFFQRDLEQIFVEVLKAKTPMRNYSRFFPVSTRLSPGAKTYTQRMYEGVGQAEWINHYSHDLPKVNVRAREKSFRIKEMGESYEYTLEDIEAAQFANQPLTAELGIVAREIIEQKINSVAWYGDDEVGLYGMINYPSVPKYVFSVAIDGTSTADDILDALNAWVNSIVSLTNEVANSFQVIMATDPYSYIASTPRSANSETTILQYWLSNNPYVQSVESAWECAGVSTTGTDVMIAMRPNEARVRFEMARPFTQRPAQERNLAWVINCIARTGGMNIPYPLECSIAELP